MGMYTTNVEDRNGNAYIDLLGNYVISSVHLFIVNQGCRQGGGLGGLKPR